MARQVGNDGDINRLNETSHYAGAADFEVNFVLFNSVQFHMEIFLPRLLLSRQVSHTLPPPDAIVSYLIEAGFGDTVPLRDFTFDNFLILAFMERWRPETHTFHLWWGEFFTPYSSNKNASNSSNKRLNTSEKLKETSAEKPGDDEI
ncbi:hypothetical protein AHAS_Ahas14G0149800 [Arachis hypogaea]